MSLIDEALKRARQDAARRDAERRGGPVWVPPAERREQRAGLPLALAVLGACLLTGVLIGGAFFAGDRPAAREERAAAGQAAAPLSSTPPGSPEIVELSPPAAAPAGEPQVQTGTETAPAAPAPPLQQAPTELPPAAPAPARPLAARPEPPAPAFPERQAFVPPAGDDAPARPAPAPSGAPPAPVPLAPTASASAVLAAPGLPNGASFVRVANLPGGGRLELRGIAYSGTAPAALLNGRVVSPGESVQGFTLVRVEPRRIELRGQGVTIFLTME